MSDDLIRRSDAIKAIEELPNAYNGWSDAYDKAYIIGTLEEVPKADRPQEWIPCSERLPKSYVEVLVCDDFGWINLGAYRPCDVSEDCSGWSLHSHTKIGTEEVIAWMPLPKPWKGTDDEAD